MSYKNKWKFLTHALLVALEPCFNHNGTIRTNRLMELLESMADKPLHINVEHGWVDFNEQLRIKLKRDVANSAEIVVDRLVSAMMYQDSFKSSIQRRIMDATVATGYIRRTFTEEELMVSGERPRDTLIDALKTSLSANGGLYIKIEKGTMRVCFASDPSCYYAFQIKDQIHGKRTDRSFASIFLFGSRDTVVGSTQKATS